MLMAYKPLVIGSYGPIKPFFTATLPLPPSVNESYKIVRVPRKQSSNRLTPRIFAEGEYAQRLGATAKLEAFKSEAAYLLRNAKVNHTILETLQLSKRKKTPLSVHIQFYFPTLWKKDVDGGIKPVQDACFKYLGLNDTLATCVSACKFVDRENPRCEIEISCFVGE